MASTLRQLFLNYLVQGCVLGLGVLVLLGAAPGQIMVFEDSPVAVQTARAAGFYTIGVLDEHTRPHWQEVRSNADTTLENWTDWCAEQQA